jgi:hypothetical protein
LSEEARNNALLERKCRDSLDYGILRRIFNAMLLRFKEKMIRNKLFQLWEEKKRAHLLIKSLKVLKNYIRRKYAGKELADFKLNKLNQKVIQRCFLSLKIAKVKRTHECLIVEEIKKRINTNSRTKYFGEWCEAFKDRVFEQSIEPLVNKYQKLRGMRLFRKRITEKTEMITYYARLDKFATEVAKKRAFFDFMEKLAHKRVSRILIEEKEQRLKFFLKQKRFEEFKALLSPNVERLHDDMTAIKFYVMQL